MNRPRTACDQMDSVNAGESFMSSTAAGGLFRRYRLPCYRLPELLPTDTLVAAVMTALRNVAAAGLLLALTFASAGNALACACCSDRGSRTDKTIRPDEQTRFQLDRMTFAKNAVLTSEMGVDGPSPMPAGSSSEYDLTMTHDKGAMTFAFKDPLGRNGRLMFRVPGMIHVFAVDPFGDAKDEGLGPPLYKEWRLTAPVKGDGFFRRGTIAGQKVTMIFHGSGRGCTEAEHFTDWSLLLHGPAGSITFYGRLEKP